MQVIDHFNTQLSLNEANTEVAQFGAKMASIFYVFIYLLLHLSTLFIEVKPSSHILDLYITAFNYIKKIQAAEIRIWFIINIRLFLLNYQNHIHHFKVYINNYQQVLCYFTLCIYIVLVLFTHLISDINK